MKIFLGCLLSVLLVSTMVSCKVLSPSPVSNDPALLGSWRLSTDDTVTKTFNSDGTGSSDDSTEFTWTTDGEIISFCYPNNEQNDEDVKYNFNIKKTIMTEERSPVLEYDKVTSDSGKVEDVTPIVQK